MTAWLKGADADPRWSGDPLEYLLGTAASDFFARHYEQTALPACHDDPGRYTGLLTLETLDAFIDGGDLRQGMLELVRHPTRIDPSTYLSADGNIIASAVAEEYLNGATIILPQLHDSVPALGAFCRALESVFSCHVQTNVYLTPPGYQGFATHYDNHDVFVLQLGGAKDWRLYEEPVPIPYRGEGFVANRHEAGAVAESLTLKPGDCLYLPRGILHDAPNAGDEPSLHITVGLITRTWADLMLEAVSELALRDPAFRRSLPAGYANDGFDREAARTTFAELAGLIAKQARMDGAFDLLAHEFLRGRRSDVAGVLAAGHGVPEADDRFRRRRFVPWQMADDDGKLALIGPGGDIPFDDDERGALELALAGTWFTAAELPCRDPRRMIRKLWANGYLERAEPAP